VTSITHLAASTGAATDDDFSTDWAVPEDWTTSDVAFALLDNGNGWSLDADALTTGDYLGVRLHRDSSHANDTFDQSVRLGELLVFQYTARVF
jgi:hypothetical protein